ncbi:glycoside hydrolase family 2 TIM barrel-domain containing protein [Herbiconiux sp. 11R-BC]|uniref:glycoside hydrolase family 2 TIM barrel-domain containing protein n=1 Tax=Herbiconiux sp. 11R-BC TaxID=3111637 RepID=UPI003C121A6E
MSTSALNDDWSWRTKASAFAELGGAGGEWSPVTLPHDALLSTERLPDAPGGAATGYFPSGAFEYRRTLAIADTLEGRLVFLEFDGVHRNAMVYVNGALAGQHAFGYSRFVVRIDPYLLFGQDNEIRVTCVAHRDSRWYTGAGIYRGVNLIVKDVTHIAVDGVSVVVHELSREEATLEITTRVSNSGSTTRSLRLSSSLNEEGIAEVATASSPVTVEPGAVALVRQRLYIERPAVWSPDSPTLYRAVVQLRSDGELLDDEIVSVGIRTVQTDPKNGLRLNGETIKLRGACIHHDNGPLGAASFVAAEERRVRILKEAGFNAIRSSHNPASTALLEACDKLGMLVIDEAFDMWTESKTDFDYASDFTQWWERDLEALVAKDRNHPSVIMYSIGNEIPETGTAHGAVWGRRLAEKIRSLDNTRPLTNGINGFVSSLDVVLAGMKAQGANPAAGGVNGMMTNVGDLMNQITASDMVTARTEESFSVLDVAGLNYGDSRYEVDRTLFPTRVILGTETFPARIAHNWPLVESLEHVIGDFTWTGWDYLGEAGLGAVTFTQDAAPGSSEVAKHFPWMAAMTGDIDVTGWRRPISYYREIVWGLRTQPYIAVHRPENFTLTASPTAWSWSDALPSWTWSGDEGDRVRVEVYSPADEVHLTLNGETIGVSPVGTTRPFQADFDVVYRPGELTAISYVDRVETGRTVLSTADDTVTLEAHVDRTSITAGTQDLAFVPIVLTDGKGVVQHRDHRAITVTVTGAGVLQALGTADPAPTEPLNATTRATYGGRALAIVRATGSGEISVTVDADGCASVTLQIRATATASQIEQLLTT